MGWRQWKKPGTEIWIAGEVRPVKEEGIKGNKKKLSLPLPDTSGIDFLLFHQGKDTGKTNLHLIFLLKNFKKRLQITTHFVSFMNEQWSVASPLFHAAPVVNTEGPARLRRRCYIRCTVPLLYQHIQVLVDSEAPSHTLILSQREEELYKLGFPLRIPVWGRPHGRIATWSPAGLSLDTNKRIHS